MSTVEFAGRQPIDQTEQAAEFWAVADETAEIRWSQNTIEKIRSLA